MRQSIFLTAAAAREKVESELIQLKSVNIVRVMDAIKDAVMQKQLSVEYTGILYDATFTKLQELGYDVQYNAETEVYLIKW